MFLGNRTWLRVTSWPVLFFSTVFMVGFPHWRDNFVAWAQAPPEWGDESVIPVELNVEGRGLSLQASKLGNHPVLIYEFVRNEIEYEAYTGSRFGAVGTLDRARGNDVDQALLLAALLRRAYYNLSRAEPDLWLVRGDVELTGEQALAWLGVEDGAAAHGYLTNADIDFTFTGNLDSELFTLVLKDHVWVRGDLEFGSMQGTRFVDGEDGIRVDLDPSFVMQEEIEGAAPPFEVSGIDSDVFATQVINLTEEDALEGSATGLPEAFMLDQSDSGAAVFRRLLEEEGVSVEDALRGRRPTIEKIDALPDALPFRLASKPQTYKIRKPAELADFLAQTRHRVQVRVTRTDTDAVIADAVLPTSHLYESKLAIAFESDSLTADELSSAQVSTAWEAKSLTAKILLDGATPQVDGGAPAVLTTDTVTYATPVELRVAYQSRTFGAAPPLPMNDATVPSESFATRAGGFFVVAAVPSLNARTQNEYYNASLSHSVATSGGGYLFQKPMTAAVGLGHTMDVAAQVMLAQTENFLRQGAMATGHRVTTQGEWSLVGLEPVAYDDGSTITYRTPRFVFGSRQGQVNLAPVVADADPQRRDTAAVQSLLQLTRDAMLTNGPDVALTGAVLPVSAGRLLRDANMAGHATFAVNELNPEALGLVSERVATNTGDLRINLREDARSGALILLPSNKTMDTPTTATGALGSGWGFLREANSSLTGTRTWSSDTYTTGGTSLRAFSSQLNTNKLTPGSLVYGGPCQAYQRLADQAIVGVEAFEGASIATGQAYVSVAHSLATLLDRTDETQLTPARQATRVGSAVTLLHALLGEFSKPEVLDLKLELYTLAADTTPAQVLEEDEIFNPAFYEKIVATGSFNQMMEDFQFYAFDGPNNLQDQFPAFGEDPPDIDQREVTWTLKDDSGPTTDVFDFVTGYNPDSSDYNGPFQVRLSGDVYGQKSREFATSYEIDTAAPEVSLNEFDPAREYRGQVDFFGEIRDVNPKEYTVDMATGDPASGAWRVLNEGKGGFGYLKLASWDAFTENAIGTYTVRLNAVDLAGNSATTTTAFAVRNDNLPPTLAIEFPDQSPLSGIQPMRVVADDGTGSGLRKLKVWVDYERRERSGAFEVTPRTKVLWEQDLPSTDVGMLPGTLSFPAGAGNYDFDTRDFQAIIAGPFTVHAKAVDEFGNIATADETFTLNNALVEAYLTNGAFNPPSVPKTETFVFFNAQASSTDVLVQVYELDANDVPTTVVRTLDVVPGFEDGRPVAPADAQGVYTHFQAFRWLGTDAQDAIVPTGPYKIRVAYAGEQVDLDVLITTSTLPECYLEEPLYTLLVKDKTPTVPITGWIEAANLDLVDRDPSLPIGNLLPADRPYWYLAYKPHSAQPVVNTTEIASTFFSSNLGFEDNWTEIAHGFDQIHRPPDEETTMSTIATWDISDLVPGMYDMRLVISDGVSLYRTCFVPGYNIVNSTVLPDQEDSDRVPGILKLTQVDMNVPMEGFGDIQIARRYDTMRGAELSEFGFGWRGTGWDIEVEKMTKDHERLSVTPKLDTFIKLPDGRELFYANNPPTNFNGSNASFSAWWRLNAFTNRAYGQMMWVPGYTDFLFDPASGLSGVFGSDATQTVGWQVVENYRLEKGLNPTPTGTIACVQLENQKFLLYNFQTGKLLQQRDASGNCKIDYTDAADPSPGIKQVDVVDNLNRRLCVRKNSDGLITEIIDPRGFSMKYEYNARKELSKVIDREGNMRWFFYDGFFGELTKIVQDAQPATPIPGVTVEGTQGVIDEHDTVIEYVYGEDGLADTITPAGRICIELEDIPGGGGRQIVIDETTGARSEIEYNVMGLVDSQTTPDGQVMNLEYYDEPTTSILTGERDPKAPPKGTLKASIIGGYRIEAGFDMEPYKFRYYGWGGLAESILNFWLTTFSDGAVQNDFPFTGSTDLFPGYLTSKQVEPIKLVNPTIDTDDSSIGVANIYVSRDKGSGPGIPPPDGTGRINSIRGPEGRKVTIKYGEFSENQGKVIELRRPGGNTENFDYLSAGDFLGQLSEYRSYQDTTLELRRTHAYDKNTTGFLGEFPANPGIPEQWMSKEVVTVTDYGTEVTSTSFATYSDADGNALAFKDDKGQFTYFKRDGKGDLVETSDCCSTTNFYYDAFDRLVLETITDDQGNIESSTFVYDGSGELIETLFEDGSSITRSIEDTEAGRLIQTQDSIGTIRSTLYDAAGRPITLTVDHGDGRSLQATQGYDENGRLNFVRSEGGASTFYTYDVRGLTTEEKTVIEGQERTETFGYDRSGRTRWSQTTEQASANVYATYDYWTSDPSIVPNSPIFGLLKTTYFEDNDKDPTNNDLDTVGYYERLAYNSDGRITQIATPAEPTSGSIVHRTDIDTYNANDRRIGAILNAGSSSTNPNDSDIAYSFSFDENDSLTGSVFPNSTVDSTIRSYDAQDVLTSEVYALAGFVDPVATVLYTEGRKDRKIDGEQDEIRYASLTNGHSRSYYKDGTQEVLRHEWLSNSDGQLQSILSTLPAQASSQVRTESHEYYSTTRRLRSISKPEGKIDYEYDPRGLIASISALGRSARYDYDELDRLIRVTASDATWNLAYNTNDQLIRLESPQADLAETRTYDGIGRLAQITHSQPSNGTIVFEATYTRGVDGRPLSILEERDGSFVRLFYEYDFLGRLVRERRDIGDDGSFERDISYEYSRDSLRTRLTDHLDDENSRIYTYQGSTQQLGHVRNPSGTLSQTFEWDRNGRLLSTRVNLSGNIKETFFTWTIAGELASVTLPSGDREDYEFDSAGDLIRITNTDAGGQITSDRHLLVEQHNPTGHSQVLAEIDAATGAPLRFYSYGPRVLARSEPGGASGQWLTDHLLADGLGSIRSRASSINGAAAAPPPSAMDYGAFGALLGVVETDGHRFTGQWAATATGLQYHRARWYSPGLGIWLSPDIAFDFPENFGLYYAYVGQSPMFATDPSGAFTMVETIQALAVRGYMAFDNYSNIKDIYGLAATIVTGGNIATLQTAMIVASLLPGVPNFIRKVKVDDLAGNLRHIDGKEIEAFQRVANDFSAHVRVDRLGSGMTESLARATKQKGEFGEAVLHFRASSNLDMIPDRAYKALPKGGFDGVFRKNGKIYIGEAKTFKGKIGKSKRNGLWLAESPNPKLNAMARDCTTPPFPQRSPCWIADTLAEHWNKGDEDFVNDALDAWKSGKLDFYEVRVKLDRLDNTKINVSEVSETIANIPLPSVGGVTDVLSHL